jgi:hypothetical protein
MTIDNIKHRVARAEETEMETPTKKLTITDVISDFAALRKAEAKGDTELVIKLKEKLAAAFASIDKNKTPEQLEKQRKDILALLKKQEKAKVL